MHARYYHRRQHVERAAMQERQPVDDDLNEADLVIGGITLTGPVTITVVNTVASSSSTTSSIAITSSSSIALSSDAVVQTPAPSSSSSSSFTATPSLMPPTSTPTPKPLVPQGSNALSTPTLSSGAIAGVVIGVLIFLCIIIFFILRQNFKRGRKVKLRRLWTRSTGVNMPRPVENTNYEPKSYTDPVLPSARPSPLSTVVGHFAMAQVASPLAIQIPSAPPTTTRGNEPKSHFSVATTAVYSPGTSKLSPFKATVVCTFITTLPDELAINIGESVRVLAEYDDGWALCMNGNGEQGMVPLECLNQRPGSEAEGAYAGLAPSPMDMKAVRRTSSLGRK